MLRVTIVNCTTDSNKGSSAITWGLIRRLKQTDIVGHISLVSFLAETSPQFTVAFRFLKKRFPYLSCFGSRVEYRETFLERSLRISKEYCLLLSRHSIQRRAFDGSLRAIADSDIVITRGGPFYAASAIPLNLSLLSTAYPLVAAKRLGIAYGFSPESIGPFANPMGKLFAKYLFRNANFIAVRENYSRRVLEDLGIRENSIYTMLDNAFWVEQNITDRVSNILESNRLKDKEFLSVTCRNWESGVMERFHKKLAKALDNILMSEQISKVALILNTYDPLEGIDDRAATRQMYNLIKNKEKVCIIEDDLAPDELSALYGKARLLIGVRLHSLILALSAGTPVLAVEYTGHKTKGIMELLGLGDFVINMRNFDVEFMINNVNKAIQAQPNIGKTLSKIREEDDAAFKILMQNIK